MSSIPGVGWAKNVFQLGKMKTLAVSMDMHKNSRAKLVAAFHSSGISSGVVLLKGGEESCLYDTDTDVLFRQDSWFNYLFGVKEAGMFGSISIETGKTTLFIPKLGPEYRIWCGEIFPPSHFKETYGVDEVCFTEELPAWLNAAFQDQGEGVRLHMMKGTNSDSGSSVEPPRFESSDAHDHRIETAHLYNLLAQCRVTKSSAEIELLRYCSYVASNAHAEVMRRASSCETEYEFEAIFRYEIYKNGGCRNTAYNAICGCGPNSAVLHYGHAAAPNDRSLQKTDMALLDMGAEYHGYVSDITCSFPVSGKFTADQRAIYEGVLAAQKVVFANMTPGVSWVDCHRLAEREILQALIAVGVLHNGTLDEMVEHCLGPVFFPHGLGHLLGCDVHDVGGYIPGTPSRVPRVGLNKLRTARVLEQGMVLTNEPGCYFIDALLDSALADSTKARFINKDVLERFRGTGGVRIEDVVLVTAGGAECLSTCPRTVDEIEAVMAGEAWPPAKDKAPELRRRWTVLGMDGAEMVLIYC